MRLAILILALFATPADAVIIVRAPQPSSSGPPTIEQISLSDTGGAAATTLLMTAPTGIVAGELLMIIAMYDPANPVSPTWDALSGWTKSQDEGTAVSDVSFVVYWKEATGSEGNVTIGHGAIVGETMGWYMRISGTNIINPLYVVGTPEHNLSSPTFDIVVPGVTTLIDDSLAFYVVVGDGGDLAPYGEPAGWTERGDATSGTSGNDVSGAFGTKLITTAGATGDVTISSAIRDTFSAVQFAIKP